MRFFNKNNYALLKCILYILITILAYFPSYSYADITDNMTIGGYSVASSTRVGRTIVEYNFKATLTNNNAFNAKNVSASLTSSSPRATVVNANLSFGDVPSTATITSSNTFTVRIDRQYTFDPSWLKWKINAEPANIITQFQPGTEASVNSVTIGSQGGTISAGSTGTPIDGIKVTIPADTFPQDVQITLGYDTGSISSSIGKFPGVILGIDVYPNANPFKTPIDITVPFNGGENEIPLPFFIDNDGKLQPVQLKNIDRLNHNFTFSTFHASIFSWLLVTKFGLDLDYTLSPPYTPGLDGFQVSNNKIDPFNPNGKCEGFSLFSLWYFTNTNFLFKGHLYSNYMNLVGTDKNTKTDIYSQDILASRTFIAIDRQFRLNNLQSGIIAGVGLSDSDNFTYILGSLHLSNRPVLVWARRAEPDGSFKIHSVLAYAYLAGGTFLVYDPNDPGRVNRIQYDSSTAKFKPYQNFFEKIVGYGDGSFHTKETIQGILNEAESKEGFPIEAEFSNISPKDGTYVDVNSVDITGKIKSSLVAVTKITIDRLDGPANDWHDEIDVKYDVTGSGSNFVIKSVPLVDGIVNHFQLIARGEDSLGALKELQTINIRIDKSQDALVPGVSKKFTKMNHFNDYNLDSNLFCANPTNLKSVVTDKPTNTTTADITASWDTCGQLFSEIGIQYFHDIGKDETWDIVKSTPITVTIDYTYSLSAFFQNWAGSANSMIWSTIQTPQCGFINLRGYEYNRQSGDVPPTNVSIPQTSFCDGRPLTLETLNGYVGMAIHSEAHTVPLVNNVPPSLSQASTSLTIRSITIDFPK